MKPMMLIPPLVFAGLAALFLWGMERGDPNAMPSTREGGPAPALTLTQLGDDVPFSRDSLADGKVKLVNFWASWCAPCRAEHPQLKAMAEQGIIIYGVNYKDITANAERMLADLGNPFARVAADDTGRTGLDWGITGVPETFVLDGHGVVVKRFSGPISASTLQSVIKPAIAKAEAQSN